MTEVEQPPPQNGIDLSAAEDDDNSKARPADIEQDMREMERRKRVEAIMSSKLFREELERIVDSARDGGGILQQLSDIMGVPSTRVGSVFKATNCMLPINDIRGVESMGYAKGEKILRCKLAATFRLLDLYGWTQGLGAQITARLKVDQENFLVNPYGMMYHEITASSLNKVDMQGQIVEQGTTNFGVNKSHFALHSVVHAARPDIRCAIYIGCSPVVAVSSLKAGLLPLTRDACMLGEVTTHPYTGALSDAEERDKLVRALGPVSKVLILSNYGALCCGETIEEAFFAASHIVQACETQLKLLPVGIDNLVLIPEESRKIIYEQSRRPPEDLEKKFATVGTAESGAAQEEAAVAKEGAAIKATGSVPKWRVGGAEFEALMRMLDNAGYRTGYIYRHPLIKSDPPKPKNDVELPPAVSSLGYLLEEEELLKQGIWKKGDLRKGGDRSRWLNSPNVYQKVEVLETGTPDPKKITKWVAEGSPTHSTPVRIEDPLQFVPAGTNPKEFKRLQQQIKDNRRADKISAGPQSHILEGVTWDEANRIKDATVSSAGDHVVLMGAASKGIIQRGFQHNAAVYKAPYAKNPFDNVTDDELNEYKRTVERKKKSIHGEYTDTDFSESEPLSSLQTSGAQQQTKQTTTTTAAVSQSEPEDVSEHQVMRIETQQAPVPSQPEVVLSDDVEDDGDDESEECTMRRRTTIHKRKSLNIANKCAVSIINQFHSNAAASTDSTSDIGDSCAHNQRYACEHHVCDYNNRERERGHEKPRDQSNKENLFRGNQNIKRDTALIAELKNDLLFQRQKQKLLPSSIEYANNALTPPTTTNNNNTSNSHNSNNICNNLFSQSTNNNNSGDVNINFNPNNLRCSNFKRNLQNLDGFGSAGAGGGSGSGEGYNLNSNINTCTHSHTPHIYNSHHHHIHAVAQCHSDCDNYCHVHQCSSHELLPPHHVFSYPDTHNSHAHSHSHTHINGANLLHCAHHPPHICITSSSSDVYAPLPTFEQAFVQRQSGETYCTLLYDPYAQYYEPVYDKPNTQLREEHNVEQSTVAAVGIVSEESENPYKKSSTCYTPAVCDSILAAMRNPSKFENNLILNIPFMAESPETTVTSATTPRKTRCDMQHKSATNQQHSPYRTTSHFGFNSPQREPQPEHKHIPTSTELKKYVPLRKSISYEEIFSSPRYVDLCENCFEKIVRLKPEIVQARTRLRNLADLSGVGSGNRVAGGNCASTSGIYQTPNEFFSMVGNNQYDYVEYASSDTTETLPPFSSQLEPVLEVEEIEPDSADDAPKAIMPKQVLERSASYSSFIDKIMRLNYSEESTNINYNITPRAASSNLTMELERALMEGYAMPKRELHSPDEVAHYNTEAEVESSQNETIEPMSCQHENIKRPASVIEIWEFIHWQDTQQPEEQHECDESIITPAVCADEAAVPEITTDADAEAQSKGTNVCSCFDKVTYDENKNNDAEENIGPEIMDDSERRQQQRRRSLMSREERSRRKLVFQELWEDHILFLDGKEQNTLSDTESAIDSQQPQEGDEEEEEANIVAPLTEEVVEAVGVSAPAPAPQSEIYNLNANDTVLLEAAGKVAVSAPAPQSEIYTFNADDIVVPPDAMAAEVFESRSFIVKKRSKTPTKSEEQRSRGASIGAAVDANTGARSRTETEDRNEKAVESDGAQSTRTFSLHTSQENLFFRAPQLEKVTSDIAFCGMDCKTVEMAVTSAGHNVTEMDELSEAAEKAVVQNVQFNETYVKYKTSNEELIEIKQYEELNRNVAEVEQLVATDDTKTEAGQIFTTSQESQSDIDMGTESQLPYEPSIEEYLLYKQNLEIEPETTNRTFEAAAELCNLLDIVESDDQKFAELVESESNVDLTKLNEVFEEILLQVENLQSVGASSAFVQTDDIVESVLTQNLDEDAENVAFNAVERKILRKIKEHNLNETENIFDKIETAIRNKLTPSKLEMLVAQQKQALNAELFATSTPDKLLTDNVECSSTGTTTTAEISRITGADYDLCDSTSVISCADDESSTLTPKNQSRSAHSRADVSTDSHERRVRQVKLRKRQRRSRSLTPYRSKREHSPKLLKKLNKTTTPPMLARKSHSAENASIDGGDKESNEKLLSQTHSIPEMKQLRTAGSKRNFILENIRNAALPRGSIKRLQGNAQAIFCKNPFGPVAAVGGGEHGAHSKTMQRQNSSHSVGSNAAMSESASTSALASTSVAAPIMQKLSTRDDGNVSTSASASASASGSDIASNSNTSTPPLVFTFQSKLVRGSPRFWVSMSQTTPKKLQSNKIMQKRRKKYHNHSRYRVDLSDSTGSLDKLADNVLIEALSSSDAVTAAIAAAAEVSSGSELGSGGVEGEIESLGEQIQQLQPRLETYKRKLQDYGEHVAKCSRHMDECIEVQSDIAAEQQQLREEIILNQYAEQITCQVQTYSISEAED